MRVCIATWLRLGVGFFFGRDLDLDLIPRRGGTRNGSGGEFRACVAVFLGVVQVDEVASPHLVRVRVWVRGRSRVRARGWGWG